jgi:PAS domain-containing protein
MTQKDIEIILLRQLASHLAMPVWVAGENGELLFYNEPAEAVLGVRFDEAGEMPLTRLPDIFHTETEDHAPLPPEELPLGIALTQRRPAHRRLRLCGVDGKWRTIEATAFPLDGEGGRRLGAVALFWEVEQ